ncbi:unnamed protein product [marine sediment metagenome]|uniref:Uncharacterized protein n=1 Tax=marine sediment metagenome TaxID=412755 RepID=X1IAE8_9ZZZZ
MAVSYYWPYLVKSYDEAKVFYKYGGFMQSYTDELVRDLGWRSLGFFPRGLAGCSLREVPPEPGNPNVPKNMKIRVMPLKPCKLTYERLGYLPAAIPYIDVYTSIQTGVIDGQMGGGPIQGTVFKDVQGCWIQYNDYLEMWTWGVNEAAFEKLPQEYQTILINACQHQTEVQFNQIAANDEKFIQEMKDWDLEIVTLTPDELAACASAIRTDVWPQLEDMIGSALLSKLYEQVGLNPEEYMD